MNGIPESTKCSIGKLCTEDPLSVSRQFSSKFHSFFQCVILKGQVLGKVAQFYWKKEYQARGAPHYHVLSPEQVLAWIEYRITCHIPDKVSNPELHRLVTRYQMHKCSNYCKRKTKFAKGKNVFVTRCKFNFLREACVSSKLNPVEKSLKARNKIFQLARSELEVRVNDYNPLLLYVWKANIDIQFVAESSLALAHYVSGYVTKAERRNLQEIWQDVSENKSIYSRLYEATDLLLGDHLTEKFCTVKWVDVAMPQKRSHRLKSHRDLKQIAEHNPDSELIFEDSLVESHYPSRPERLTDMCLYDFVAWIDWTHRDKQGEIDYRRLIKPRLPNHKAFNQEKEEQREDYYYSLILLFVPFRDEGDLLLPNETAQDAFQRLTNASSSTHHKKLQTMLAAQSKINKINETRHKAGTNEKEKSEEDEDDGPQFMGEAKFAMDDALSMNANPPDKLDLDTRVGMLNAD